MSTMTAFTSIFTPRLHPPQPTPQPQRRPGITSSATPHTKPPPTRPFDLETFTTLLYTTQTTLCTQLETLDGHAAFTTDPWTRGPHSSGITRVLQHGALFEKAGVNVSAIQGELSSTRAAAMRSRGREIPAGTSYVAAALSFVLHANSPFVPTLRGDVRVFAADGRVWGGGGVDLTVFYVDRPQIAQFHRFWKRVLDDFGDTYYPDFKRGCDEYFYLPFRDEYRGVGGLFYDELELPGDELLAFQNALLTNFLPSFQPILDANRTRPWTEEEKRWQRIRRGRYLEFNLITDRGVKFGLAGANASRTDSILISAPPSVEWPYAFSPPPDSPEHDTLQLLGGPPVDWANE